MGHTHNYGWVHRIGQPGDILGFRDKVNPAELHINPDSIIELVVYELLQCRGGLLQRDIGEVLSCCIEALGRFHALGGNARLYKKSV